jgi:thiol-disulfide isomerase/thioredoxin
MRVLLFIFLCFGLIGCSESNSQGVSNNQTNSSSSSSGPVLDSNVKHGPMKIDVTVEGKSGGSAYLIGMYTDQNFRVDSVGVSSSGKFTFENEEGIPSGLYFVIFPDNRNFQLLIDKDQQFSVKTKNSSLGSAEITGCLESELFYQVKDLEAPLNNAIAAVDNQLRGLKPGDANYDNLKSQKDRLFKEKSDKLNEIFNKYPNNLFTKFKNGGKNPQVDFTYDEMGEIDMMKYLWDFRKEYWNDVDFNDARLLRTPVIQNKLKSYIDKYTIQHPDSLKVSIDFLMNNVANSPEYYKYFANWIALNFEPTETKLMDSQAIYVHMVNNYFTPEKAVWSSPAEIQALKQRASEMELSLVGLDAPDVVSTNPRGQQKSIYEMDEDYIVVYMYNPDCEHCQEETPKLKQFYDSYKSNGFGVYAIAIDTEDDKWKKYIDKVGIQEWVNVHDPSNRSIYGKYFVDVTPELYLINPDRKIIAKNLKTHQVIEMIEKDKNQR